jgi:hypothetical protein
MLWMPGTDAARRALSPQETARIQAARLRATALYLGEEVPHHSCGAALAVTFGVSARPYQSLRRGGIHGDRFCGSIRGGEMLLGEILGDEDPTAPVTPELREAMRWYQEQIPSRFDRGTSPDFVCNNLVRPLGDFMGSRRKSFCTDLSGEVAALTLEAILRFAPELCPATMLSNPIESES